MIDPNETSDSQHLPPLRILLVEDNEHDVLAFHRTFKRSQVACEITRYVQAEIALERLQYDASSFDLLVADHKLPGMSGLDLCLELLDSQIPLPLVILTGTGTEHLAIEALKAGVDDYLIKDPSQGYLELLPVVLPQVVQRYRDHLARQQAEAALRQYAAELQERNKELDAFAHTVAHDLKNPLSLIIGYIQVLEENYITMTDEELQMSLRAIARSGRKMSNIIDALLTLTSVRKQDVKLEPLDMSRIVAEAQQRLTDMIEQYQAQIILPDTWPEALGYASWVEEVWTNYLSNAFKYGGQPPHVELGATTQADGMVRFWIRDNGPGLTPEEQARLFTPFTRLNQVRVKGYGLGLSIVRRIVEKLGGQVGVESQVSQGCVFWFILPAQ